MYMYKDIKHISASWSLMCGSISDILLEMQKSEMRSITIQFWFCHWLNCLLHPESIKTRVKMCTLFTHGLLLYLLGSLNTSHPHLYKLNMYQQRQLKPQYCRYVSVFLTIISDATPYAIQMDSSQIRCQNLQLVRGLQQKSKYQNNKVLTLKCQMIPDLFDNIYFGIFKKYIWNRKKVILTVKSTFSSTSCSSSFWTSSSSFDSVSGQYQSSLGTTMLWKDNLRVNYQFSEII